MVLIKDIIKWLNDNNGAVTATSTVFLAVFTAWYVYLLNKERKDRLKRELSEKIYSSLIEEIPKYKHLEIYSSLIKSFELWNGLKGKEPFLVSYIKQDIKYRLDGFSKNINKFIEETYNKAVPQYFANILCKSINVNCSDYFKIRFFNKRKLYRKLNEDSWEFFPLILQRFLKPSIPLEELFENSSIMCVFNSGERSEQVKNLPIKDLKISLDLIEEKIENDDNLREKLKLLGDILKDIEFLEKKILKEMK